MDAFYSKAKPKVVDYNPITHMSFYNQPASPPPYSPGSPSRGPFSNYLDSPSKYPRSTSLAGKNIFSQSNSYKSPRSSTFETLNGNKSNPDSPRYYKTRPKNRIVDPISGEVKVFAIDRPRIENLDTGSGKDKLTNEFNYNTVKKFQQQKGTLKSLDNIAGSLKKEVPYVPYVDPFMLKNFS